MRSLKPYLLAVGGFIAAVLGIFFSGVPSVATAPVSGTNPDLQSKRVATSSEVVASREAKPASKTPVPASHSPAGAAASGELPRPGNAWTLCSLPIASERIVDVRQRLLVGVIELRI